VLPISLGTLIFGYLRIVNVSITRYSPIDLLSVVLSVLAFGGLVYGLSSFGHGSGGGESHLAANALYIGVVSMVLFIWRQIRLQKAERALLDLRTFRYHGFTLSLVMMSVAMMVFFGALILLPIYMQNVLGLSTLKTGLIFLPGGLVMGLMAPFVGQMYDRYGPSPLIIPGAFIFSGVLWAMTQLDAHTWWGAILIGHILMGIALSLVTTPLFTASLSSIPEQFYSHGSAILGSIQQLAGAAGIALLVAVMTLHTQGLLAEGTAQTDALAGGIATAFVWGAAFSLIAVASAFFVPRPPRSEVH